MQREVSRPVLLGALAVTALTAALVSLTAVRSAPRPGKSADPPALPRVVVGASVPVQAEPPPAADPGFERYRRLLQRNPFAPRLPRKAPAARPHGDVAPVLPSPPRETPEPGTPAKTPEAAAAPAPTPAGR